MSAIKQEWENIFFKNFKKSMNGPVLAFIKDYKTLYGVFLNTISDIVDMENRELKELLMSESMANSNLKGAFAILEKQLESESKAWLDLYNNEKKESKSLAQQLTEAKEDNKKLHFMIQRGLGYEDMID